MNDPIVEETREARRQLDAEFGGDLNRIYAHLREIEHENADRVVRLEPKPVLNGYVNQAHTGQRLDDDVTVYRRLSRHMTMRLRRLGRSIAAAVRLGIRDPRSLLLSARMSAWIVLISIVARLVPLSTMFRLAETRRRWPPSALLPAEEIARRIDRVFHAGLVTDGSCWKRAAVLRRYLQLNGIDTDVVFGVRRQNGEQLAGHAWLEREGVPFLEGEPPRYTVTFRHPSR